MTAYIGDTSSDVVEGDTAQKSHLVHGISPVYQIREPSASWIKEQRIKKLAILTVDGTWGTAHTEAWEKAAKDAGAEVVMAEMMDYPSEPTTLPTLIVKAKSLGVDGIVQTGTEAGAISLIKKMHALNYNVPVLGTVYLKNAVDTGKVTKGNLQLFEIESKGSETFRDKYRSVHGVEPGASAEPAYDLAVIATYTELEKGTTTAQEYLLSKEHNGFADTYKFDSNGDVINHGWKIIKI
jgi:ABC-type branched-subunit amino acid transport system substrate-binding protein